MGTGDILGFHPKPRQEPEVPALPTSLSLRDKETLNYLSSPVLRSKTKQGCRGFKPLPEFEAEPQSLLFNKSFSGFFSFAATPTS